jgi:5-(carboxyamino)imidazole ribonucleotide mutase
MGSTSDLSIMKKASDFLNTMQIPFEMLALSAHRTPDEVADFAHNAHLRGVKVVIAGAGMAAALPGVIAAITPLPVIGVPLSATLQGQDALLSIAQMPPGIPVATTGIDGAMNAAVLATRILALTDSDIANRYDAWRSELGKKIVKANADLKEIAYEFKTN